MNKRLLPVVLLAILSLPYVQGISLAKASPDAQLVIISPHWEGITREFEAAFNAYYQATYGESVDIEWLDVGGTSDVIKYVDSQFESTPDGIQIDIWWGGGVDPFIEQAKKGTLVAYQVDESVLSKIPADIAGVPMYDEEYTWYGSALSGFGIVYNKAILQLEDLPTPETWEDLTDPAVKGWVGSADPRHSGSTHMAYEIILQAYGWEEGVKLATMLGANVKTFPPSSSAIPKSVGAGDVAYGLAIDFYAWSEVAKVGADNIGYLMPDGLTVVNPDSIAILKGAPNLEVAQRFLTYVLSEEGQKLWMLPVGAEGGPSEYMLGRMSVIPELFTELADVTVVPIDPYQMTSTLEYNATLGSLRYSFVNDLIGATIIDSHDELVSTWNEINAAENALAEEGITSTKIEEAKDKLGEVPITLEASLVAAGNWSDASLRNQYITEWHRFALSKYESASILTSLAEAELLQSDLESEKEEIEATYESEVEELEAQIETLATQHESEIATLTSQYVSLLDTAKAEKQSSMYTGLGGGAVVGLIVGFAISYYMARQKEIAAVRA
jgi:ABC-type Fe3+ transport system substrate-binding protein